MLRKDFLVDAYQVWEAADAGGAAVLLIVAALGDEQLTALLDECSACGLDALVEVHDEHDLERALAAGARLIGVNNRNLRTLSVDLAVTDYETQRTFYKDTWGLTEVGTDGDLSYLAAEGSPEQYVIRLRQADENRRRGS